MSTDRRIRTWIRPTTQFPESVQRAGAEGQVYVAGKEIRVGTYAKSFRKGEIARVQWLYLLACPRTKKNPRPVRGMHKIMDMIEDRHAIIEEWGSGIVLRSDNRKQLRQMLATADEMIRSAGRSQAAKGKAGRPRTPYPQSELAFMERRYLSTKIPTTKEAVAVIRAHGREIGSKLMQKISGNKLYRLFGPSGRANIRQK